MKATNFLIFLLVKNLVKESGFDRAWNKVWKVLIWRLDALRLGVWPSVNWDGCEFADQDSIHFQNRGAPWAGGFSGYVFLLKSDIELLLNHFRLNSPTSNQPCSLCQASRDMGDKPWTDCRSTATWRASTWTKEARAASHPDWHPFFSMHGAGIDLVFPDLMHCKHLGSDQLLVGSALMPGTVAENLDSAVAQGWACQWACH